MRKHYGETNPVVAAVDSSVVIEIGDLLFLNTDDARPAGQDTNSDGTGDLWNIDLATTQESFHDKFLGVACQASRDGDTDPIRVATTGVFEFACDAATFEIGDLVGPAKTSGNNLENGKVVAVAGANLAIGRVAKRYATNTTTVLVSIESTVMRGGPQAAA